MAQGQHPKNFIPKGKVIDIINHIIEENEELGNRDVVRELEFIIDEINNL